MERQLEHPFGIGRTGLDPHDKMIGRHHLRDEIAPLHDGDPVVVDQLVEAEVVEILHAVEPVHVDVREPAAGPRTPARS